MNVVLIEDHDATREIFKAVLETGGYDVVSAPNGEEGLDAVRKVEPDVVITDIAMPGIDGIQLVRTLGGAAETRRIPVIAATAQSSGYDPDDLKGMFAAVLRKPVSPSELLSTIRQVLAVR